MGNRFSADYIQVADCIYVVQIKLKTNQTNHWTAYTAKRREVLAVCNSESESQFFIFKKC